MTNPPGNPPDPQEAIDNEYRKDLRASHKSAYESFDKALLTLSSGGLALSISLVKDIVPAECLISAGVLKASWFGFVASILLTIVSIMVSQSAIARDIVNFDALVDDTTGNFEAKNPLSTATAVLNYASFFSFLVAVVTMTVFASMNFPGGCKDVGGRGRGDVHGNCICTTTVQAAYTSSGKPGAAAKPAASSAARPGSGTGTVNPGQKEGYKR